MTDHGSRVAAWAAGCALLFLACGGAQAPAVELTPRATESPPLAKRRADVPDDCEQVAGQPPPEPLRTAYSGVAKAARCDREVYTIMGGVTHFLGVECKHCHQEPDYAADTHNKRVANWMARELVPRLAQRTGGEVWCKDCHAGRAKLLGNPRRADVALEWMLTHLVEDFQTTRGLPPKCKDCHGADLGSPDFRNKIVLTALSGPPLPMGHDTAAPFPAVLDAAAAPSAAPAAPSASPPPLAPSTRPPEPIPDFGGR